MKFLSLDSPLMRFLNRMTDILWLNILTLIFCIPAGIGIWFMINLQALGLENGGSMTSISMVEILIWMAIALISFPCGAAFTALHYVLLKLVRDEEGYITKDYFKSFKQNFKQATVIWLLLAFVIVILGIDFRCLAAMTKNVKLLTGAIMAAAVLVLFAGLYVFAVLSHFVNTIKGTIKNAFLMSIYALPRTLLMVLLLVAPIALLYLVEKFQTAFWLMPLIGLFCISLPAYYRAKLYNGVFKKFEPESAPVDNDDFSWTVGGEEENGEEKEEVAEQTEE